LESLSGKPNTGFDVPAGIVTLAVDNLSGFRAHDGFSERNEIFIKGREPGEDTVHLMLKVCKSDGKLATPADIQGGNYESKEYYVFKEEDPTALSGSENKWQKGVLEWLSMQGDIKYHPTECADQYYVSVDFREPNDHASNLNNQFMVKLTADSTVDIVEVKLYADGIDIRGFTSPPYETSVNLTSGVHELKVKARDSNGKEAERTIKVGVMGPWDYTPPTPTPSPTLVSTPTLSPAP
jgi:hypothetical protein